MEGLIIQQKAQRELLQKCIINTKKESRERRNKSYYERRLKQFEDLWAGFQQRHKELLVLQYSDDQFDINKCEYFAANVYDQVEEHFMLNVVLLEDAIIKTTPPEPNTQANTTIANANYQGTHGTSLKLPKLAIEKFNGDYKKWTTFHDLFRTMIHENTSYAPVQKLQYLKLLLEGEPENLIRHLQITDDNYEPTWALLKERYDNKRVLVWFQLDTLFSQPIWSTETAQGIRKLLDITTECLLALENLKLDVSSWDPLIVYLVVKRLPSSTHQLWEQSISGRSELPTWKELQEFLKNRFRTLEAISSTRKPTAIREAPKPHPPRFQTKTFHVATQASCVFCSQPHNIRQCSKFLSCATSKRMEIVRKSGLCINCLGSGHISANCPSARKCRQCNRHHHTLLHHNTPIEAQTNQCGNARAPTSTPDANQTSAHVTESTQHRERTNSNNLGVFMVNRNQPNQVLLATALVRVVSHNGKERIVRALIDQGSQASFITESVKQDLQLKGEAINANIYSVEDKNLSCARFKTRFIIKSLKNNNCHIEVTGLVLRKVTDIMPTQTINQHHWTHLKQLELADPEYHQPGRVELLLGADVYGKIIMEGLVNSIDGSPVAQKTRLGWILSGEIQNQSQTSIQLRNFHVRTDVDEWLKRFWELEEIKERPLHTEEEDECEALFARTTRRSADGRYEVQLPLKAASEHLHLGKSRSIAISRLLQMERRFIKDPKLKQEYSKCVREYLELGHMTRVSTSEEEHRQVLNGTANYTCSYLPHHGVIKETSTTTKLRVVFDASRSTDSGVSLNDMMLKGPVVQDDLITLLIRWRKHCVAFTADLEKMYRQIRVRNTDADYQRIVWRDSTNHPIEEYKLLTVTFGTKSAPYLATRTIKQLAHDEKENYPKAYDVAVNDFYVDDLLSGSHTIDEALLVQQQLLQLMNAGGFSLRKWSSNCKEMLKALPPEYRETNLSCEISLDDSIRALGIFWKPASDILTYAYTTSPDPSRWTKRTILSEISKLFDPLGLLSPIIIEGKLFIQTLWLKGLGWDEEIPENLTFEWLKYKRGLSDIDNIKVCRWTHYKNTNQKTELHGFSDASMKAYAAVVYLCVVDEQGNRHTTLIAAKTKVAPLKTVTLPRLELCAASLLAKLMRYVTTALKLEVAHTTHAWTDSEIVIAWLNSQPYKWKTFIANRVSHIHETLGRNIWNHVPSKQNPADCASRGMNPSDLIKHELWWNGPTWLQLPEEHWPKSKRTWDTELEQRKITSLQVNIDEDDLELKYSSLTRLLRITAYCKRFVFNIRRPISERKGAYIKSDELNDALQYWLHRIQQREFNDDIKAIRQQRLLPNQSRLKKLNPFLDERGILRVGGRLFHSELSYEEKFPTILPDKCHLTILIINKAHKDTMHGGTQLTMQTLAQRYWILNARNTIRQQIHKCLICYRQKAITQTQLMGHLPAVRTQMSRPFTHTGVDYCGPFELKTHKGRNPKKYKAYIALFVCMTIKALHLEVVTDLSAEGFIAAFRRFTARRGLCNKLYCDNGTNFVGANRLLKKQNQQLANQVNNEIGAILENDGVSFDFIPPSSPHFGGLWEAGVKSTKYHIRRVIGNTSLTYEEFTTTLTQIEACLNSRPLTEMSTDPEDLTPLTPAHFLTGGSLLAIPEPSLLDLKLNHLNRWQLTQRLVQHFWKRWKAEYLNRLQQRPKWLKTESNLKPGELVLVKEDNLPPCQWALGRITDVYPGKDGLIRVVSIKIKNNILKRPITKVCRLPFQRDIDHPTEELNNKA